MYNIEKIKEDLKHNLSQFRYEHSLLVAEECQKLAIHYGFNEKKAYIAGLVHDIAKEFDDDQNFEWIEKYHLSSELLLPEYKNIIHANIGAVVVREWYNLDEEICNAVCYHTIGNVPMNWLDKIVFVADKIARQSTNPIIEEIKILAYQDIDKALALYLTNQKHKLESTGREMHPTSLKLLQLLI